jgi:Protein of unknown function (DUF3987)
MRGAAAEAIEAAVAGDLPKARVAAWQAATVGSPAELLPNPWDEPEPPPFKLAWLPPILRRYVKIRARVSGCQTSPLAWSCLGGCSAALDGSIRVQPKYYDPSWKVPPDIWVVVIGRPSSGKSPALSAGYEPIFHIQDAREKRWQKAKYEWDQLDKETQANTTPPKPYDLLYISSQTTEGIRDALMRQNRGILVFADEFGYFLGGMGRYSGGRDAAGADRNFFNTLYNGQSWPFVRADRKGDQRLTVRNLQGGVAGGTHPDYLHKANQNNALLIDGLFQRSCPIFAGKRVLGERVETAKISVAYEERIRLLIRVKGDRTIVFAREVEDLREDVERQVMAFENNDALGMGFTTAAGKLHGIFARLSLLYAHLLSPMEPPNEVSLEAAEMAYTLMVKSLIPNMLLTYRMLGSGGSDIETTKAICGFLLREQRVRITASDVMRHVHILHSKKLDEVRAALSVVVGYEWLEPEGDYERQARAWTVNQAIYDQFADKAKVLRLQAQMAHDVMTATISTKPGLEEPDQVDAEPEQKARKAIMREEGLENPSDAESEQKARKAITRATDNLEEPSELEQKARKAIVQGDRLKTLPFIDKKQESARAADPQINSYSRFFESHSFSSKIAIDIKRRKLACLIHRSGGSERRK